MAEFKKVNTVSLQASSSLETPEQRYWRKFVPANEAGFAAKSLSFSAPVTDVCFSPAGNHDFAVTSSTRVCIYDGRTAVLKRTLARFKNVAEGTSYRYDGRLLASGCRNSWVYVFNAEQGSLLRLLKGHKAAVKATAWAPKESLVLSCSDDQSARLWDISTETQTAAFLGHSDQVRSCTHLGAHHYGDDRSVWATGSFDHTVRLWDSRISSSASLTGSPSNCLATLACAAPVEAVLAHPIEPTVLAAVNNVIKVFDVRKIGECLAEICDHQKTITSLFVDSTCTRLLSASLDGLIKVSDARTYDCTATIAIGGKGILAATLSPANKTLLVGCASGDAFIRRRSGVSDTAKRKMKSVGQEPILEAAEPMAGTKRYFMRGGAVGPSADDFKVSVKKRQRYAAYDKALVKFNYREALSEVLKTRQPVLVAAVLEELQARNGLEAALAKRDDAEIEPLLSFLVKFVTNPRYASILTEVCNKILDIYGSQVGQSVIMDELFVKLQNQLNEEVRIQKSLKMLSGTVDLLLSAGSVARN